jgi:diacylglycerol kinase family enzyme
VVQTPELIALVVAILAVVVAGAAILLTLSVRRSVTRRESDAAEAQDHADAHTMAPAAPADRPLAAVVCNPSKFGDVEPLQVAVRRACADLGWAEPLWLETSVDDPGTGQARQAVDAGADLVVACGGDGTVRKVAHVLAGTNTALGLVPAGTGNLLARNLDVVIPRAAETGPDDVEAAMRVALTGDDRRIDVGWISVTGPPGERPGESDSGGEAAPGEEQLFLVMAGMGFDAAVMATVPEALKAKVGPIAYFVSGARHLRGHRTRVRITIDGAEHTRRVRTVVVGNVGKLQGGLALMPDAEVDDGWLDLVAIGPRGMVGWLDVAGRMLTRRRRVDATMGHWRGRRITIRADAPQPAQIDGDPIGDAVELALRVDAGALLIRVAAGAKGKAPSSSFAGASSSRPRGRG